MKKHYAPLLLLFLLLAGASVDAQVVLTTQPGPSPIYSGYVSCIGDVNGDGRNDVLIGTVIGNAINPADNNVIKVHLQTAAGTLAPAVNYPYKSPATGGAITGIDIADLNNDGRKDVVYCYNDSVGILFQNASGGFQPLQRYYSGSQTAALKTGDMNNDGLPDIVVCNHGDLQLKIFFQTSNGFTTATYPVNAPGGYDELETGDLNGDGRTDVALCRGNGVALAVLFVFTQTPNGTLTPYVQYNPPATNPYNLRGIEIVDLNNDGLLDVAATRGGFSSFALVKWIQDPVTHLLQSPTEVPVVSPCFPVEAADLDCDGHPDIVTAGSSGFGNLLVFSQDSSEGYNNYNAYPITQHSGLQPQALSLGDYTGDGRIDIVIADFNYGMILLHNAGSSTFTTTSLSVSYDTLSTTTSTQHLYFTKQTSYNNGAGYWVTRTDSLRATTTTRRDSIRVDTVRIVSKPACPGVEIDTLYSHSIDLRIGYIRDTLLLSSRRDSLATGVSGLQRIPGLRVYPVPARGEVCVEATALPERLRLLNLMGGLLPVPVWRVDKAWVLDVSELPPGMYQLQVAGADGQWESVKVFRE